MHLLLIVSLILVCISIDYTKGEGIDEQKLNKNRLHKVFWMGMILFLFAALRHISVGIDVQEYAKNYELISKYDFKEIMILKEGRDPVFSIFCKLLTYISASPNFMLAVIGAIVAFSFSYYVYNQKGDVLLSYILFITFRLYAFTLTGLRQALALSLCWIAFVMLQKRKNILFFVLTLTASLFHLSAIVFVLAWIIYKFSKPMVSFTVCAIIAAIDLISSHAIISVFSSLMTEDRFEEYTHIDNISTYTGGGTFYLYIFFFAFMIFAMFFGKKDENTTDTNKIFNVACVAMMIYVICQNLPVFFRMSYYFILPFYTLIPKSIDAVFKKNDAFLVRSFIILMLTIQYLVLTPGAGITNYQFFWTN